MNCPNCNYEPVVNEFDYTEAPGQFFDLGIEAKRAATDEWCAQEPHREPIYGCPNCGVMFMNIGYQK